MILWLKMVLHNSEVIIIVLCQAGYDQLKGWLCTEAFQLTINPQLVNCHHKIHNRGFKSLGSQFVCFEFIHSPIKTAFYFCFSLTRSFGRDPYPLLLDDLRCSNRNYLVILQCSFRTPVNPGTCNDGPDDASVTCSELMWHRNRTDNLWFEHRNLIAML